MNPRDPEGQIDRRHPFAVAPGQVIVDRDDVDPHAAESVEVSRQGGDQGLAFAGDHLGDHAAVQDDAADDLHIVMAHVLGAASGFAASGKGLGQDVIQRFARLEPFAKNGGQGLELLIG